MLSTNALAHLIETAKAFAPQEMCGLFFELEVFCLCPNASCEPMRFFELGYDDYRRACEEHGGQPWALVHSHPGRRAGPSVKDCRLMDALQLAQQDWAFIIVGLSPVEVRCFRKVGELYQLEWCTRQTEGVPQRL